MTENKGGRERCALRALADWAVRRRFSLAGSLRGGWPIDNRPQLTKLDVAGSSPVSRSIFSITCMPRRISSCLICLNWTALRRIGVP